MIPYLIKEKLVDKYGEALELPSHIDMTWGGKIAYSGLEHDLQKSFFDWLSKQVLDNPYLYLAHAIPNGGTRNKIEAGRLKAEGVKAGIPDVFIPIPNEYHHGLYIEFKTKGNRKPSEDQRAIILMLNDKGYRVVVVDTLETAKDIFKAYMSSV